MTQIKAVIFDLGGTLLYYNDSQTDDQERHFRRVTIAGIKSIYRHLIETAGLTPVDDFSAVIEQHIAQTVNASRKNLSGGTVEVPIRAALVEIGATLDDEQWQALRPLFYQEIDQIVFPRPGLQETLQTLADTGYQLGLLSNTFWASDLHDGHLQRFDILNYLPHRAYSCDTPYAKPHPAIFTDLLAEMKVTPEEAVYVGDTPEVDVVGAQKAGMRAIRILSPYVNGDFADITPDAVINELPELPAALAGLG